MAKARNARPVWPEIPTGHLMWIVPRAKGRLWLGLMGSLVVVLGNGYWLATSGELALPRWFVATLCAMAAIFLIVHTTLMLMIVLPGSAELRRRKALGA